MRPNEMPQFQMMKDEYDFSKGERGRFFHADAALVPPSISIQRF